MRKLRLLSDWLLVEIDPTEEKTSGGIIKLDKEADPIRTGVVVQAGPGRQYTDKLVPMEAGIVGKRLAFMMAATQTKAGEQLHTHLDMGENFRLIRLGDVLLEVDKDTEVG